MDRLGLSPADFRSYLHTLHQPGHKRRIRLDVLALSDGSHLRSLTPKFIDGTVTGDTTARTSRMLDIDFLDEQNSLGFEPNDPSDAPLHRSRMLRVHDDRFVEAIGDWVACTVFTGPMIDFQRQGGLVTVTANGLEEQALGAAWESHHFPPKTKLTNVIRNLLAAAGDVNAVVPDLPHTLPHRLTIHPLEPIWPHVKHLAAALDRYVFYDGHAQFRMRPHTQRAVYRFNKVLLDTVTTSREVEDFFNTVVVLGPNPKGPKKRVRGEASIEGSLSPADLNRHDVPLHKVKKISHQHLKTNAQAQKIADRWMLEHGTTRTDLTFPTLPIPMLEERDMTAVDDDAFGTAKMRISQWSLPLEGGDPGGSEGTEMTVGSSKRTKKARVR